MRPTEYEVVVAQIRKDAERFAKRLSGLIEYQPESGCMLWTGTKCRKGYGKINFRHEGKHVQFRAHRVFAVLITKKPIPPGYQVDHICMNQRCVRHLQVVTPEENRSAQEVYKFYRKR